MTTVQIQEVRTFIRKMATPYTLWEEFNLGIINDKGEVNSSYLKKVTKESLMVINMKRQLDVLPEGRSLVSRYAAAQFLIQEWGMFTDNCNINEATSPEVKHSMEMFKQQYNRILPSLKTIQLEDVGGVSAGAGAIAGIGVNQPAGAAPLSSTISPFAEPGISPSNKSKYVSDNKKDEDDAITARRKLLAFLKIGD